MAILYHPFVARTSSIYRPVGPVAYDCVKVIVVRDGSAFVFSEFGHQPVKPGDVILLGANVLAGSEPEGHITVTTIYLDTDYVLDQVCWQYAAYLEDRLDAQQFVEAAYTEPAQILRLGEKRAGLLLPWPDELLALSVDGDFVRHYFRLQALWFQIAYVIAPFITVSPARISPSQRACLVSRHRSPLTTPTHPQMCHDTLPTICHDIVHPSVTTSFTRLSRHRSPHRKTRPATNRRYNGEQQPQRQQNSPGNTGNRQTIDTLPGRLGCTQKTER